MEFSANDFTVYLKSGTPVSIKSQDPYLNGKSGVLVSDRLPQDTVEITKRSLGPIRNVRLDSGETIQVQEEILVGR